MLFLFLNFTPNKKNSKPLKKIILLSILLICFISNRAVAQFWMQKAGSLTIDEGIDVASDTSGNTYATGYFTSTAHFGALQLVSSGIEDIYITKLNSLGIFQWAKKAGGTGSDRPTSIATDAAGNSYITGYFYNTATFGAFNLTSSGIQDIFIAKYNTFGTCLWAKKAGGAGSDIGNGITVDAAGNVVVTGEFIGAATFGSFNLTSVNNSVDIFTAKLDASGNFLWVKQGASIHTDRGIDVACTPAGDIYVTGQFSDTVTFDFVHYNTLANAIFLIKYDANGIEQWFRIIGSGNINVVHTLALDATGNPFIAGDFQGTLTFFAAPTNTTLTNPYPKRIFVAKYDSNGNLVWSASSGSNSSITANNMVINGAGNAYVVGNFTCKFNQYADQYGQGTFNSVGFNDIYVTEWDPSGQWLWSRQAGGHKDDNGAGIAISTNKVLLTGSFGYDFNFPENYAHFLGYNTTPNNVCYAPYCTDPFYNEYEILSSYGNKDIFIANAIDTTRQPYDYWQRSGSSCDRNTNSLCIEHNPNNCIDSIEACFLTSVTANTHLCNPGITNCIGPTLTYQWSNGGNYQGVNVNSGGNLYVTVSSEDGCFVSVDSVYVNVHLIATPLITDDHGHNTQALYPAEFHICYTDSAIHTGSNYGTNQYRWLATNYTGPFGRDTIHVHHSDTYTFEVIDAFGCSTSTFVNVTVDSVVTPVVPGMICVTDSNRDDTIKLCLGKAFTMFLYDSLTNPSANLICVPNSIIHWTVVPNTISYLDTTTCGAVLWNQSFQPSASGLYTITADWLLINTCDTLETFITKSIYVNILPTPIVHLLFAGNPFICPGDSNLITLTGYPSYLWSSPNHSGNENNPIWASIPGNYSASKTVTFADGCQAHDLQYFFAQITPQPNVTTEPSTGIICPNDSVQLTSTGSGLYVWYGPSGPVGGDSGRIYVSQPGDYYCIDTDTNACTLVSNSVTVVLHSTPYLVATPDTIICTNDSVLISVMTEPNSTIQWLSPLTGSSLSQYVYAPGTYSCNITSCNIVTLATINIAGSAATASFIADTVTGCAPFTTHFINTSSNASSYLWNFGDNTTSTLPNPSHAYTSNGLYTVTLICYVSGSCNDTLVRTAYINVHDNIVSGSFAASPVNGCIALTVNFSNTSTNGTSCLWNFGDNQTSTATNPSHTYTDSGTYSITLITYNTSACGTVSDTLNASDYITVFPTAAASFTADTVSGCAPFSVQFTNTSTSADSYLWDFGDASTSATINPNHTYTIAGTYTVSLIAYSLHGCNDTITMNDYIIVHSPTLPSSSFSTNMLESCKPTTISFNNTGTNGTSFLWSFGDGTHDTSFAPTHVYDTSGIFAVSLITYRTSFCGVASDTFTITNYITIYPYAVASFTPSQDSGCIPFSINFMNTSTAIGYEWAFGDGNTSTITNPNHTFSTPGNFIVTLIAYGDGGCNDTLSQHYFSILNRPVITGNFSADTSKGCTPITIHFLTDSSNATTWLWNFGDSTTSIIPNPNHTYTNAGTYFITVILMNDTGFCKSLADTVILSDTIAVAAPVIINANFVPSPRSGCPPLTIDVVNTSSNATSYYWDFGNGVTSTDAFPPRMMYLDSGNFFITLIAYNINSRCENKPDTISLEINADSCHQFYSNIFSPNGDGYNDKFIIIADGATDYHLIIFNRWGQELFETVQQNNGWDGYDSSGNKVPDGTYYFIFTATDLRGKAIAEKGFINLMR